MVDFSPDALRRQAVPFAKTVLSTARERDVPFMAGSIAYQAFVSLLPLLVLVFFFVSFVGDESLARDVVSFTRSFLPPEASQLLGKSIAGNSGSTGASVIGLVTLVWGTLKVFRGLDTAFSQIYSTSAENTLLDQVADGLVMLFAIGGALLAAGVAVSVVSLIPIPGTDVLVPLVLVGALALAFYPMYVRFPDVSVSRREVLPGVVVAALGWAALEVVFQFYVQVASRSQGAGVIGAAILLLTWLYFGGLVLLLGGVVNAVVAGQAGGDEDADPTPEDVAGDRLAALTRRLYAERDRRQRAERERDRLLYELAQVRDRAPDADALLATNRALAQRLRWERRPLPVRAVWRLLGRAPPDPTAGDSMTGATGGREGADARPRDADAPTGPDGDAPAGPDAETTARDEHDAALAPTDVHDRRPARPED